MKRALKSMALISRNEKGPSAKKNGFGKREIERPSSSRLRHVGCADMSMYMLSTVKRSNCLKR